jgi:allantoate deiminase
LVLAVEKCGVTATVGQLSVQPGASNVIPGRITLTLDVRDLQDARRQTAVRELKTAAQTIARRRKVKLVWSPVQDTSAVACDVPLTEVMCEAAARHEREVFSLPSGAGHDAAALAAICPVAMLFVRCKRGLSHHPAEAVRASDVAKAIAVLAEFIEKLGARHA